MTIMCLSQICGFTFVLFNYCQLFLIFSSTAVWHHKPHQSESLQRSLAAGKNWDFYPTRNYDIINLLS